MNSPVRTLKKSQIDLSVMGNQAVDTDAEYIQSHPRSFWNRNPFFQYRGSNCTASRKTQNIAFDLQVNIRLKYSKRNKIGGSGGVRVGFLQWAAVPTHVHCFQVASYLAVEEAAALSTYQHWRCSWYYK
jgi:hypothetical protein